MHYLKWKVHVWSGEVGLIDLSCLIPKSTPVLINNFNRYAALLKQIDWLNKLAEPVSIIIIDNNSTYPPLLDYYSNLNQKNIQVVSLNFNSGIWGIPYIVDQLPDVEKYVITDPDLVPYDKTPLDTLKYLSLLLDKHPEYNHVGLSIEINDLPECYALKETVEQWEQKFWPPQAQVLEDGTMVSCVDTTFAMYRRDSNVLGWEQALRTPRPYTLRHVDWYECSKNPTAEYQYYLKKCRRIASWANAFKLNS